MASVQSGWLCREESAALDEEPAPAAAAIQMANTVWGASQFA